MLRRKFCILKKMTFVAFHYLTLLVSCEEIGAHINYVYLILKSTQWEYILARIAHSPLEMFEPSEKLKDNFIANLKNHKSL
jgi:hypothetical protein